VLLRILGIFLGPFNLFISLSMAPGFRFAFTVCTRSSHMLDPLHISSDERLRHGQEDAPDSLNATKTSGSSHCVTSFASS